MKNSFKKALTIFKYLSLISSIIFWVYMIIDDWCFVEKYWNSNWAEYIKIWAMYFIAYFLAFSVYYWLIASAVILIYHKIIQRNR